MPADQFERDPPVSPWGAADAAFAALETALRRAAVESTSPDGFKIASSHLAKVTDMRARFAERRMLVTRREKEG